MSTYNRYVLVFMYDKYLIFQVDEELTKEVRLRILIKQVAELNTRLGNKEAPPFFSFSEKSALLRTSSTLTMCPANIYITLNGTEGSPYEGTPFRTPLTTTPNTLNSTTTTSRRGNIRSSLAIPVTLSVQTIPSGIHNLHLASARRQSRQNMFRRALL